MQLALILALLLLGSNNNISEIIGQLKPVIEDLGDENIKSAISSIEQISGVLNAFSGSGIGDLLSLFGGGGKKPVEESIHDDLHIQGYPLKPVSKIIDKNITYALSQFFAEEI